MGPHMGPILDPYWAHYGPILSPIWGPYGPILGPIAGYTQGFPDKQTNEKPAYIEIEKITTTKRAHMGRWGTMSQNRLVSNFHQKVNITKKVTQKPTKLPQSDLSGNSAKLQKVMQK